MKKSMVVLAVIALVSILATSCASAPKAEAGAAPKAVNVVLRADKAKLVDGGGEGIRLEGGGNVGYWSSTEDLVKWDMVIAEAGDYTVMVDYSVDKSFADAVVKVSLAGQDIEWKVESTDSWGTYKKAEIGTVTLAAGTHPASMQATAIANRFVANVKSIILTKK